MREEAIEVKDRKERSLKTGETLTNHLSLPKEGHEALMFSMQP